MEKQPDFISVPEAARHLGISRQAAWGLVRRGALAARIDTSAGRSKILVRAASVSALIADPTYAKLTRKKDREEFCRSRYNLRHLVQRRLDGLYEQKELTPRTETDAEVQTPNQNEMDQSHDDTK